MLDDIVAHGYRARHRHPNPCDQGSPVAAMDQDRQPPPRASNRSALLIAEQTFQKQACIPCNPFLPEQ